MKTGNQVQLCVKLDVSVSEQLSLESMVTGKPKNRIINDGVLFYTNIARLRRMFVMDDIDADNLLAWLYDDAFTIVSRGGKE